MMKTSDALKIIDNLTSNDPDIEDMVRKSSLNTIVAQLIYEARTTRGMTQKQLADLVGTKQSAIARLENADYDGHSLSMLQKVACALNQRVEIKLLAIEPEKTLAQ